jgi:hypothetical protein
LGSPGQLEAERNGAAVLPLAADRVALIGGNGGNGPLVETVSVDAAGEVVTTPTTFTGLEAQIDGATVVQDGAGAAYLVGGIGRQAIAKFDPKSGSFATVATLAVVRTTAPTVVACGDRVIVAAGGSAAVESWTLGASAVESVPSLNAEVDAAAVCLDDGEVLLSGRAASDSSVGGGLLFAATAPSLRKLRGFEQPRSDYALVRLADGSVALVGGAAGAPAMEIWVGGP